MIASTFSFVVDIGPGAGVHGGHIVAQGTPEQVMANPASLTGQYLTGMQQVPIPHHRRKWEKNRSIRIKGARANNLKNVSAEIPLGVFTCVTGVSGGGKSTLLIDTVYRALARKLMGTREPPSEHDRIDGMENLDKIIDIDQSPIGRTPRSNPASWPEPPSAFRPARWNSVAWKRDRGISMTTTRPPPCFSPCSPLFSRPASCSSWIRCVITATASPIRY